ncbi:MAG TPA: acetyl-CoA C-acetyltransferase [Acidobacteriota bacterium]|nr:acetyl-CoA C-acetyltransferase [Acidobacteriota bacterium]
MRQAVILSAARTAIGSFQGTLSSLSATQLGSVAIKEAITRSGVEPAKIDDVIMGNVVSAGLGQAPARQAAIHAGVPVEVPAMTINKVCGSSLKAVALATQSIKLGDADIVVAGGMESMSNCPYILPKARTGLRMGNGSVVDLMIHDGLWDSFNDFHMGETGEIVAEKYNISRERQDEYAFNSQRKAVAAIESGKFKAEIVPVEVPQRKGDPIIFEVDEGPRAGTTIENLAKLRPAFRKDGTVTAGNASTINDGGAALVVAGDDTAVALGVEPLARIVGYAVSGVAPEMVMMAPVPAVKMLLEKINWTIDDVELMELNEAFSVQAVACCGEMGIDFERVNVNGGAVALGHPIGCTGARILTTLIYAMIDRGAAKGVAALCLGGGNAVALAVER